MLERLLNCRANEGKRFERDGISITMTVGYTPDGAPGGVPPEIIRHAVTRGASEEPASILGAVADSITKKSFLAGV